jgi:membrane associated rhomboid family serine protease
MARSREVYMSFFPPLTPMLKALVVVTSAAFVVTYLPYRFFGWQAPFVYLGLQPYLVVHRLYLWQLVTYLFLHGGFFHILFNMFALWMFGSDLERLWGGERFLYFYFLCGVGAGVFDVVLNTLFPPAIPTLTIGCSGAIYGILLAYGLLFPDRPIFLWFIIPIKAKWFVLGIGVIEFLSEISGGGSGISHLAHLGGMLVAFLYLRGGKWSSRLRLDYAEWRRRSLRRQFEVYKRKHDRDDGEGGSGGWVN